MVCLACLLPIFLIPIVNALPFLFYFIVGKVYHLLGWEYRKPERVPASCPYRPPATPNSSSGGEVTNDRTETDKQHPEIRNAALIKED
ncbi:hypothetical protein ZOSMA_78G00250 [Zostera marina]|uniref:Transmembrane protein n=1 Tax=Zostera marina TaxID=29655 RepID=A0A0K9NQA1_ZOSMR|nr:hypothetical protein ZOSMA_78G00250 [Zostera marina]